VVAKPWKKKDELLAQLEAEIAPDTAGDPCGPTKWLRRSLRGLKALLAGCGVLLSHMSIRRLLKQQKYSLKVNRKSVASTQNPQRDQQFRYIRRVRKLFTQAGHPVISVDTKKKELIGNFKNAGETWNQEPELVNDHDFPDDAIAKAVPYGIYDVVHNQGYVYVGTSSDTAAFAVDAIGRWFERQDRPKFTDESKILILCDAGGSNGYRVRNWKRALQHHFADRYGVEVMVCHYPSGASKWNPIEHRLFSFISLNWAGIPLRSLSRMTALIRGTTTQAGLVVKAAQLKGDYPTKVKVSDAEMAKLNFTRRRICPLWNYVISPTI
jgi:Rhodopirellula transposase DDE domain